MVEVIPILSGAILGAMLAATGRPSRWMLASLVVVLAACATYASGEYHGSWGYLLVDAGLVLAGAAVSFPAVRAWRALLGN